MCRDFALSFVYLCIYKTMTFSERLNSCRETRRFVTQLVDRFRSFLLPVLSERARLNHPNGIRQSVYIMQHLIIRFSLSHCYLLFVRVLSSTDENNFDLDSVRRCVYLGANVVEKT
jgi:hypothetical protein